MQLKPEQTSPVHHSPLAYRGTARATRKVLVALGASLCLSAAWADIAQPLGSVGELRTLADALPSLAPLPSSLVRVVYFRDASEGAAASPATRVFVDGRFHTALSSGNFSMFCLPAGLHTLASVEQPTATYNSSANLTPAQLLMGGNTYMVQAGNALTAQPVRPPSSSMIDTGARPAARYSMNQSRLLSRARTVACPVQQAQAQP